MSYEKDNPNGDFLLMIGLLVILGLLLWSMFPGIVVSTTESVVAEKEFEIKVGGMIPYKEHIKGNANYVFLGYEKDNTDASKKQIKIGKRIPHDVKGGRTYEVQELNITVEQGKQIPIIDTSDTEGLRYVKLYFESVSDNTLTIKAEEIGIKEKRKYQGAFSKEMEN